MMRDQEVDDVKQESYLGASISNNLKMSDQCTAVSIKANVMFGKISRNFDHNEKTIQYLRPHLEYATQCCSQNYIKNLYLLEEYRAQRQNTFLYHIIHRIKNFFFFIKSIQIII